MSVSSIGSTSSSSLSLLQQWQQKIFSSIDANSDGSITKSELETAVTKAGGTTDEADALYAKLDPDNTGSVSETQFSSNMPVPRLGDQTLSQLISYQSTDSSNTTDSTSGTNPAAQFASDLFSSIDSDGDGSITKSELETAVTKAGGTTEEADALYSKLDPDGTGSVSEETFAQAMMPPPPPPPPSGGTGNGTSDSSSDSSDSSTSAVSSTSSTSSTADLDALKVLIEALEEASSTSGSSSDNSSSSDSSSTSSSSTTASTAADDALKSLIEAIKDSSSTQSGGSSSSDGSGGGSSGSNSNNAAWLASSALQNLLHYYAQAGNLSDASTTVSVSTSA